MDLNNNILANKNFVNDRFTKYHNRDAYQTELDEFTGKGLVDVDNAIRQGAKTAQLPTVPKTPTSSDLSAGMKFDISSVPEPNAPVTRQAFVDRTLADGERSLTEIQKSKVELEQYEKNQAEKLKAQAEADRLNADKQGEIDDFRAQINPIQDKLISKYGEATDVLDSVDLKAKYAEIEKHTNNAIKLAGSMNDELQSNRERGGLTSVSAGRERNILDSYASKITAEQATAEMLAGNVNIAFDWVNKGAKTVQDNIIDQQQYLSFVSQLYDNDILKAESKVEGTEATEKAQIDKLLTELDADMAKVETSKEMIKGLMNTDPSIMSKAGLEFTDTEEEIMTKVSDYYVRTPEANPNNSIQTVNGRKVVVGQDGTILKDLGGAYKTSSSPATSTIVTSDGKTIEVGEQDSIDYWVNLLNKGQANISNVPTGIRTQVVERAGKADVAVNKPLSETALAKMNQTNKALDDLYELRFKINDNLEYVGPLSGWQKINPWSPARKIQADIDRVKQTVGKALEGGVLRKEDEEKYKKILATITDTPETAMYKIDSLVTSIQRDVADFRTLQSQAGRYVPENNTEADSSNTDLRNKYNY